MIDYYYEIERIIKESINKYYGFYLNDEQKRLLNTISYLDDIIINEKNMNIVFDTITTKILKSLINKSYKEVINNKTIPCSDRINNILLNYYKKVISNYLSYTPRLDLTIANEIDYLYDLNNIYRSVVDKNVFSKTIEELKEVPELEEFINEAIQYDIDKYIKENK